MEQTTASGDFQGAKNGGIPPVTLPDQGVEDRILIEEGPSIEELCEQWLENLPETAAETPAAKKKRALSSEETAPEPTRWSWVAGAAWWLLEAGAFLLVVLFGARD